ncbi:unnamed protein product [Paramecium octaurelia]|uniref:WD40-repeat-containing domain n=1 Tax=Paramecium octaurelia TaxID=43137 RepID=A0A8S1WTU4_PAROT|nr:unnamed protein product [Paramecium octaurelia]
MNQQKNQKTQFQVLKIASRSQKEWCQAIAINDDCSLLFIGFKSAIKAFGFNKENLKQHQILNHHTNYITALKICKSKFASSNYFLISASDDKTIIIWEQAGSQFQNPSWSCYQRLYGHENNVNCFLFLEEEECIISGSADFSIKFWNTTQKDKYKWSCLQTIQNHSSEIWALSINQSQDILISSGEDGVILVIEQNSKIWIVKQIIQVKEFGYRISFVGNNVFCFQPVSGKQLHVYQMNNNQSFIKSKDIILQEGNCNCKPYFPATYIKQKSLLISKVGCKINLISICHNSEEEIDFGTTDGWGYIYGSISDDGVYIATWDYKSQEIQIRELKEKQEIKQY